ncbi:class I SAM-dependent methyltransferase [Streptomyces jumonjinensis]|uniref:class I SAM-dependent methyltransferase n=1 Tax=Streptomyces jumonjinensis TaxID=1945 RepID=UPI0037AF1610
MRGPVLELGVGTGRIALPLAETGVHVDGLDFSEAMAAKLRSKAAGLPLSVLVGDMTELDAVGRYSLVIAVHSALTLLQTQEEQLRCVRNAARALLPGGGWRSRPSTPKCSCDGSGARS